MVGALQSPVGAVTFTSPAISHPFTVGGSQRGHWTSWAIGRNRVMSLEYSS